mmetsp:Transcript_174855/g.560633  ORF Transcript_174855/g.560633 Transcript_174855/m.560633 type:complete len:261 (-) Transcript_174855:1731-2513(-)
MTAGKTATCAAPHSCPLPPCNFAPLTLSSDADFAPFVPSSEVSRGTAAVAFATAARASTSSFRSTSHNLELVAKLSASGMSSRRAASERLQSWMESLNDTSGLFSFSQLAARAKSSSSCRRSSVEAASTSVLSAPAVNFCLSPSPPCSPPRFSSAASNRPSVHLILALFCLFRKEIRKLSFGVIEFGAAVSSPRLSPASEPPTADTASDSDCACCAWASRSAAAKVNSLSWARRACLSETKSMAWRSNEGASPAEDFTCE